MDPLNLLLLAATIGLPLIKFLLFPARAMGRGGNWTLVGAAMIVVLMMAVWFGVQSLTAPAAAPPAGAAAQSDSQQLPDLDALSKLL